MSRFKSLTHLALGITVGYSLTQFFWVFWQLVKADPRFTLLVPQNKAPKGITSASGKTESIYFIQHVIEDGIERISYIPKKKRFDTPILMQHGMFHGAWCWVNWQALFAEWGWETHAISLPGHGKSPVQRPLKMCTLDYYLGFIRDEVKKMKREPILMGHSMGGTLIQWYLKYIGQPTAAVLVAPWVYNSILLEGTWRVLKRDPSLVWRMVLSWDTSPWVRNPKRAAELFISPKARVTPDDLYAALGPESALVIFQHNPPLWNPPEEVKSPTLWLAGEIDAGISVAGLRKSAQYYRGDFVIISEAGHNLMMEYNSYQTAETIHQWLISKGIE
jgi:pimeloyl-ACP methyl ester carboxylesterase